MKNSKAIVQKIVLAGIVIEDKKILILQRSQDEKNFPGMWELPSGKREPLELSYEALKREVKEETGLIVETIKPVSVFDYQIEKENEIRDVTQINILVRAADGNVKLSNEHQKYYWLDENKIDDFYISPETKNVLLKVFNLINCVEEK